MAIKILLIALLSIATASAAGCCRGYKILQFGRTGMLPMYEGPPPCGSMYDQQEDYCDGSLYPTQSKYDAPVGRYYPSYMEPKTITHKTHCVCSKSVASQRMVTSVPRYYKRGYCSDLMDSHYACGQYPECGQYNQCGGCPVPHPMFRQSSHRVMPLTLPASCVC